MDNKEIDELKYSLYAQRLESDLPNEFLDECLGILEDINSKKADCVNWEERAKMDEATNRSGTMLFDEEGGSDTYKILNGNFDTSTKNSKKKKPNAKEAKPKNEQEEALMTGLADIMGQIGKLDEVEEELKKARLKNKDENKDENKEENKDV